MDWFRWFTGSTTDPKFQIVARKSGQNVASVLGVWAMLLERACQSADRGAVDGFDCEGADVILGLEDGAACSIVEALKDKGLILAERIAKWEARQPKKEDPTAAERKRTQRERERSVTERDDTVGHDMSRDVTQGHAESQPVTPCHDRGDKIREEKKEESPLTQTLPPQTDTPVAAPVGAEHAQDQDAFYLTRRKRKLRGQRLDAFNRFWRAFAYQKGKAAAADAWLDIPELTDSLVAQIVAAAEREATARSGLLAAGRTPKMAQGWISERRWEDGPSLLPMTRDGPPGDAQPRTYAQCQDAEQRMIARMIKPRDFDGNARRDPPGAGQGQPALRLEAGYGDAGTGRGGVGRDPG
jgi:hypothetical protein